MLEVSVFAWRGNPSDKRTVVSHSFGALVGKDGPHLDTSLSQLLHEPDPLLKQAIAHRDHIRHRLLAPHALFYPFGPHESEYPIKADADTDAGTMSALFALTGCCGRKRAHEVVVASPSGDGADAHLGFVYLFLFCVFGFWFLGLLFGRGGWCGFGGR